MALIFDEKPRSKVLLRVPPSRTGVVSWNSASEEGAVSVRVRFGDESWSGRLPYVRWEEGSRVSLGGRDERARFEIDTLLTTEPFTAVEVDATAKLDGVALATPPASAARNDKLEAIDLDVPFRSQYVGDPGRGWCSPASLSMLLAANGVEKDVGDVAAGTYDVAYHGTGNWAFNVAFASRFGLRSFVAFLRDLVQARTFLEAGVPLALSITWKKGELDRPPLEESDGHIVVLRGFDASGDPILNDPAQATIRTVYPRAQFERLWLSHGGVAYVVSTPQKPTVELANA